MSTEIGDGTTTLFWEDRWLHGQRLVDIAPHLYAVVSKRNTRKRTVVEALNEHLWLQDARGASTVGELNEFFALWDLIRNFALQPKAEDRHYWRLCSSGQYSAKSTYSHLFLGATQFGPLERTWQTWAPGKCKLFSMACGV
ncbi:hypothetical protein PR202_gn00226 [Eleusine coracana subsp. coracana]|uniref:Uncharacterized protein n=1 Tax=Eleusine coracana subsp. coracana TaxID=191504 RepID=A0AAV5FZ26_ELECO|nr:hypothetical protein PR202_gn00226 [Eleusine coracana subsp. coracana]